ncbi:MAG: hypothetical protein LUF68_02870, partial [Clostridiales bacterium]|nr:hypothetical protein [Clostridiales bacterium]
LPVPTAYTPSFVMGDARMSEEEIQEAIHRLVIVWKTC